jgi:hypothetical protein
MSTFLDKVSNFLKPRDSPEVEYYIEPDSDSLFCRVTLPASAKTKPSSYRPDEGEKKLIHRAQSSINSVFKKEKSSLPETSFIQGLSESFQLSNLQYTLSLQGGPQTFSQTRSLSPWEEIKVGQSHDAPRLKSSWRMDHPTWRVDHPTDRWVWCHPSDPSKDITVSRDVEGDRIVLKWWTGVVAKPHQEAEKSVGSETNGDTAGAAPFGAGLVGVGTPHDPEKQAESVADTEGDDATARFRRASSIEEAVDPREFV